ncbi:EAL domain-containing protein [Parasalinivibrio latis]|uniref:EAL domain-containing protein n=1 Tax=Parasalinivibrio latis TaxID=2952610 RepID=UPI0030E54ED5
MSSFVASQREAECASNECKVVALHTVATPQPSSGDEIVSYHDNLAEAQLCRLLAPTQEAPAKWLVVFEVKLPGYPQGVHLPQFQDAFSQRIKDETPYPVFALSPQRYAVIMTRARSRKIVSAWLNGLYLKLRAPLILENDFFYPTLYALALQTSETCTAEKLLAYSQCLLHTEDRTHGCNIRVLDNSELVGAVESCSVTNRLPRALYHNRFSLHYQAQYTTEGEQVVGLEALMRWNEPGIGPVSPAKFIPAAEKNGMIAPMTVWLIEQICRDIREWLTAGLTVPKVWFNLSAALLGEPFLTRQILNILKRHNVPPDCLGMELTETSLISDAQNAAVVLSQMISAGIEVAIDDYGSGFTSINSMFALPFNQLKIDRCFMLRSLTCFDSYTLLKSLGKVMQTRNISLVYEGIETESQRQHVQQLGANYIQGFLLARPEPREKISALLANAPI